MSKHHRLVGVLLVSFLAVGCTNVGDMKPAMLDCSLLQPQDKHTYKLMFKTKDGECVEKVVRQGGCNCDADALIVHACDTVEWQVTGNKKKSVAFDKGNRDSPFDWSDQGSKSRIVGMVRADAAEYQIYGYTVRTEGGCALDPMIIVHPRQAAATTP
jgi:hypothetical protein